MVIERSRNQVLIIGYVWVEPNSSAAGSRMLQLIETFIAHDYQLTFASPAQKNENAIDLETLGVNEVSISLNASSFDHFLKDLNPAIVMFDRFMMEEQFGWRVAENCPDALRILDSEDLHFLRKVRHKQLKNGEPFTNEALLISDEAKREIAAILRCDLTLIVSSYEMELLKEIFKIDKKLLLYLPFLLHQINAETIANGLSFKKRAHFVFIGNYLHLPNVDTVLQLKKVWKYIRKQLPTTEMHVYGSYLTQQIKELHKPEEGFLVKGYAEDAKEVVRKAKIVLAPIRFGAGIKGKLTEAMICGTPSITTSIGAEGMHDNLPWHGTIEDDFELFPQKAVALYTNEKLWKLSQQNGIEIINTIYQKEKLAPQFLDTIKSIQNNLQKHRQQNFLGRLLQHQTLQATKYMSKWIEAKNKK